jgi:hypothetical protein
MPKYMPEARAELVMTKECLLPGAWTLSSPTDDRGQILCTDLCGLTSQAGC